MTLNDLIIKRKNKGISRYQDLSDYFDLCRLLKEESEDNKGLAYDEAKNAYRIADKMRKKLAISDTAEAIKYYELAKKIALFLAYDNFEYYLLYVEWNREPKKKFYVPRQSVLGVVVNDLQDLEDGKLDLLAVSLPPRVGKSTLGIFFVTWIMGRHPDLATLMSGHSDKLTEGFYNEIYGIIQNEEYLWHDVFIGCQIANTSAKNETIDINKKRRFPTLTCRSISGTLTGAVEVGWLLYVDDIIEDLEEALNPQRLDNKYNAYLNQLKDRKKDGAKELHIGTRWSVNDVIGRIERQYEGSDRVRFRIIPALNENGESNFNYPYGLGFSTEYYLDMRESIDNATWCAKYLGEPYEREGVLFPKDEMLYYNGVLPGDTPDRIIGVCDVAFGGGDSLSMPIAYIYGNDIYIHDWIFNKGDKEITEPLVCEKIIEHKAHQVRFEGNNGGDMYKDDIDRELKSKGIKVNLSSKKASTKTSKVSRIIQMAPDIKKMYFRNDSGISDEYKQALKELWMFLITGKNKHDDAPDSLAQLVEFISNVGAKVTIIDRPF